MTTDRIKKWTELTTEEQAARAALPPKEARELNIALSRQGILEGPRRLVRSKRGTWGRTLQVGCRAGCVAALTLAECVAAKVEPGPGNY